MASDDLVERLRFFASTGDFGRKPDPDDIRRKAADRIAALEAENARLRKGRDFYAGKFADRCGDVFKLEAQLAASDAAQERARIVAWLTDGLDQANEGLCDAISAENRRQREKKVFEGDPYFKLFADAIKRGDHLAVPAHDGDAP